MSSDFTAQGRTLFHSDGLQLLNVDNISAKASESNLTYVSYGATTGNVNVIYLTKIGTTVRMVLNGFDDTVSAAGYIQFGPVPAEFRPSTATTGLIYIINNSTGEAGVFQVESDGTLKIGPVSALFAINAGSNGWNRTEIQYYVSN